MGHAVRTLSLLVTLTVVAGGRPLAPGGVFRRWDGEWRGTFVVYAPEGTHRTTLRVHHVYRSRDDRYQTVAIEDTYPDGRVVHKKAVNTVEDGRLRCRVYREDGRLEAEHVGALVDGQIFWSSRDQSGRLRQFFRERIVDDEYLIDGFGLYGPDGGEVEIYVGRYRRIAP